LELSLRQGFLPVLSNDEHEIPYGNERVYYAGKARVEPGTLILGDYVDRDIAGIIWNWRLSVYNPATGQVNYASQYKKQASLLVAASDGTVQRQWQLIGTIPLAVNFGDLDMASSDQVLIQVSLRYDKAIYTGPYAGSNSLPTLSAPASLVGGL